MPGAERPAASFWSGSALLGSALGLLSSGCALSAPGLDGCARLHSLSPLQADWEALHHAQRCSQSQDLSHRQRAAVLVRVGEVRAALGDSAGAEQAWARAAALAPASFRAWYFLAQVRRERGGDALAAARAALQAAAAPQLRAWAYRLAGEIQADRGDRTAAQASLAQALALSPDDLDALRALVRLKSADRAAAAALARAALGAAERAPSWCRGAAFRYAAEILVDARGEAGALESLARALAIDPDDIQALQAMARIRRRRPDLAVPAAPRADPPAAGGTARRRPGPGELDALRALFQGHWADGRRAEAARAAHGFAAAVWQAPPWQRFDAYRLSVEMGLDLGDERRASLALDRMVNRDYQSLETYRLEARVVGPPTRGPAELARIEALVALRKELGDWAGAQATLERAIRRFPDAGQPVQAMVEVMLSRGLPEQAQPFAERLVGIRRRQSLEEITRAFPNNLFYAFRDLPPQEQVRRALQDPAVAEKARRIRDQDIQTAQELLQRVRDARLRAAGASGPGR